VPRLYKHVGYYSKEGNTSSRSVCFQWDTPSLSPSQVEDNLEAGDDSGEKGGNSAFTNNDA